MIGNVKFELDFNIKVKHSPITFQEHVGQDRHNKCIQHKLEIMSKESIGNVKFEFDIKVMVKHNASSC